MYGAIVQAIWDHKNLTELAEEVKICPRMALIWLWSRMICYAVRSLDYDGASKR